MLYDAAASVMCVIINHKPAISSLHRIVFTQYIGEERYTKTVRSAKIIVPDATTQSVCWRINITNRDSWGLIVISTYTRTDLSCCWQNTFERRREFELVCCVCSMMAVFVVFVFALATCQCSLMHALLWLLFCSCCWWWWWQWWWWWWCCCCCLVLVLYDTSDDTIFL